MEANHSAASRDHRHRHRYQVARTERNRGKDQGVPGISSNARFYRFPLPAPYNEAEPRRCHACGTRSASVERSAVQAPHPVSPEQLGPHGENRHGRRRSKRRSSGRLVQARTISRKQDEGSILTQQNSYRKHDTTPSKTLGRIVIIASTISSIHNSNRGKPRAKNSPFAMHRPLTTVQGALFLPRTAR